MPTCRNHRLLAWLLLVVPSIAQESPGGLPPAPPAFPNSFGSSVLRDQAKIFTSPARIRKSDFKWLLPMAGTAAALFATDNGIVDRIHAGTALQQRSRSFADVGLASLTLMPLYAGWQGWRNRDSYTEDTGLLAARAVVDSVAAEEVLSLIARRPAPSAMGAGRFFTSSATSSSFGSLSSTSAWAIASVMADRHPGWLTKMAAYGLASGVSLASVTGKQHAPSDVFVASALGFLVGQFAGGPFSSDGPRIAPLAVTNRAPSDSAPSGAASSSERLPSETHAGSTYVPMSSWIYPALDRLAALGLIPSQTAGLRPWTRAECRRQLFEAQDRVAGVAPASVAQEAARMLDLLHTELDKEAGGIVLESVYVQEGVISGPVLNDSFHLGQTWSNNYGRPFGTGWNSYTGFTSRVEYGSLFAYVTGEYQHAPGADPLSQPVRQTLAGLDGVPTPPAASGADTNRFRFLDTYIGGRVGDFEISVGKQSLWWGPTADSPLSFSTNAEPTKNLRVSTVNPLRLPGFLKMLGEIRGEFILGKLGGQKYTWRPWFNAQKLTFKLSEDLELGFTRWSILWGVGHPITMGSFVDNFVSTNSPSAAYTTSRSDPGDRKAGFDFRLRVPGLRNWLTLYSDSYSDDDPSPLAAPRRAAINPGLYLSHVPGVPKLDIRLEAPSTTPMMGDHGGTFLYYNTEYRSGNTNYGYLLGSPVGRDARALQASTTYWFSPRRKLQAAYRQTKGGGDFLPGGLTQTDVTLNGSYQLAPEWQTTLALQYERFWIPLLGGPRRNLSATLQVTWIPNLQLTNKD